MKFKIDRASSAWINPTRPCAEATKCADGEGWEIEINSLEELMELVKREGYELIIDSKSITIYDHYVE